MLKFCNFDHCLSFCLDLRPPQSLHPNSYFCFLYGHTSVLILNFDEKLFLIQFGNVKLINDTLVTTGNFQGFETPYQEGDYDLIANPVVMKDLRLRIVDYTVPYMDAAMVIVIKNDLRQENNWLMYLSIMSPEVWFLMIITLIFPCLILSLEEMIGHFIY